MENKENTVPDVPNIHSEHFKEEFYKWFEDRGLLSDLRTYMRQLMVKALEESNKNGKTSRQRKPATSPKLQAINLLLVDYLFHEDYLYTVSVFASEAEILASLPQYSSYVAQTVRERRWEPSSLPRFSQQETEDILDTLRLPPSRREALHTSHAYLNGNESLLTCIVRTLTSFHIHSEEYLRPHSPNQDVDNKEIGSEHIYQLWSQEMQDLLLLAGVKLQHIRRMQHKWALTIDQEKLKAKKEADDLHAAERAEWQEATEQRLRAELEEEMRTEQQLLKERQSKMDLREQGLADLANQLTAVHDDITLRLSQLQLQGRDLQEREVQQESLRADLEERLSRLQAREEQLHRVPSEITFEASGSEIQISQGHTELEDSSKTNIVTKEASVQVVSTETPRVGVVASTQTLDPGVAESTQTLDTEDREQQTSCSSQPDPQLLEQLQMDREKISELQEENLELRAHALQQRHRIDELTNRAASLSSQLEESQVAIAVLSGRESAMVATPPIPPVQPPPVLLAPTFGYSNPQRIGAGEESLFAPRAQQTTPRSDGRRRPLRFAFSQNPSPTTEESSPTDEVIQQARARIRQLEQESFAIQRSYQEFQTGLLTTDSVMFPPLPSPRIHNPVMRVRRSDFSPFVPLTRIPYPPQSLNNYHSRFRPIQRHDEENEESSSDQTAFYESGRIENITNSRRMFTQRNIRQYERWKQFKKKFQRRDVLDYSRRNLNVSNSNTSSDEEEGKQKNVRKRQDVNKQKKTLDGQNLHKSQDQPENHRPVVPHGTNTEKPIEDQLKEEQPIPHSSERKQESKLIKTSPLVLPLKEEAASTKLGISLVDKIDKEKLKLGLEKSAKLIQSVKLLLEAPNNVNRGTSTLTNGSLAVDSLPIDSGSGSPNEILKTDSSILTVQSVNPGVQKGAEHGIKNSEDNNKESTIKALSQTNQSPQNNFAPKVKEIEILHSNYDLEEEKDSDSQIAEPSPLSVPTLRLVSPGQNVESEDFIEAVAFNSSDVAEQESGDKGTPSVTSGSDILRELNQSKTESSESILSTGLADDSKHSSDFWN